MLLRKTFSVNQQKHLSVIGTSEFLFQLLLSLTTAFTLCQFWSHLWPLRLPYFQVLTLEKLQDHEAVTLLPNSPLAHSCCQEEGIHRLPVISSHFPSKILVRFPFLSRVISHIHEVFGGKSLVL